MNVVDILFPTFAFNVNLRPYDMEFTKLFVPEDGLVLSADVRDVYFQSDPFEAEVLGAKRWLGHKASLLVFQEGLNDIHGNVMTITNQKNNKRQGCTRRIFSDAVLLVVNGACLFLSCPIMSRVICKGHFAPLETCWSPTIQTSFDMVT